MPTSGTTRFTGGASVILASGKMPVRKLEGFLLYKDQDIRNVRNVNYVDLGPRTKHNLISCLWTAT